jgi:hypothetical protein
LLCRLDEVHSSYNVQLAEAKKINGNLQMLQKDTERRSEEYRSRCHAAEHSAAQHRMERDALLAMMGKVHMGGSSSGAEGGVGGDMGGSSAVALADHSHGPVTAAHAEQHLHRDHQQQQQHQQQHHHSSHNSKHPGVSKTKSSPAVTGHGSETNTSSALANPKLHGKKLNYDKVESPSEFQVGYLHGCTFICMFRLLVY